MALPVVVSVGQALFGPCSSAVLCCAIGVVSTIQRSFMLQPTALSALAISSRVIGLDKAKHPVRLSLMGQTALFCAPLTRRRGAEEGLWRCAGGRAKINRNHEKGGKRVMATDKFDSQGGMKQLLGQSRLGLIAVSWFNRTTGQVQVQVLQQRRCDGGKVQPGRAALSTFSTAHALLCGASHC
jgi:hypothetical protein